MYARTSTCIMYRHKTCMVRRGMHASSPSPFYSAIFAPQAAIIMVELSWSQTPSSVWWALETGTAASNLSLDNILSPPTPNKTASGSKRTLHHQLTSPTIFYNSLDETDFGERDEDLEQWVSDDPSRGIIRSASTHAHYSLIPRSVPHSSILHVEKLRMDLGARLNSECKPLHYANLI